MGIKGVDISEHNGNVDFAKMKKDGIQFVILRTSWGHFTEDNRIRENVAKCKKVGMPYGFYHYSYANTVQNAQIEAESFLKLCKELGGYTYPLVLDMEDADKWKVKNGVSDSMNLYTIEVFKNVLESAGEYMMLYMSKSWFDRLRKIDKNLIDSIDPWLAHWGISKPSMTCGIWQYTSDGVVNGSSARTDMNIAYKDYPSILANMKKTKVKKKSVDTLAKECIDGQWNNGTKRKTLLESKGYDYNKVQQRVNEYYSMAQQVIQGVYGNYPERKTNVEKKGFSYDHVQKLVNDILS